MSKLSTGQDILLVCGHERTVAFNDPHDTDALFWCNVCDGQRAVDIPDDAGEDPPMGPGTAYAIVSDAIPDEVRGEELDEALGVLFRLAESALDESEAI